jgi:hypothetical protein
VSPARSRPAGAGLWHSIKPNSIGFANAAGDLAGGVTAAIVALPLALAFGVASGAGPVAGIYGAICVGLFAALFGGTPTQISGPTGPMTIVSASLFTQFGDEPAIAFTVVMLTGLLQIGFGALRIGRYVNLMPYPVISGFMTGIGGILLLMQIEPLLGRSATAGGSRDQRLRAADRGRGYRDLLLHAAAHRARAALTVAGTHRGHGAVAAVFRRAGARRDSLGPAVAGTAGH